MSQEVIADVDVEKLTKDATTDGGKIDLDMAIEIYWSYEDELKQVLSGDSGDFETKMKGFIDDYFNEAVNGTSDVTFSVDYDTYYSTSGAGTATIFATAIVMVISMF